MCHHAVCLSVCVCVCVCGSVSVYSGVLLSLSTLIPFVMKHLPISPFIIAQQEEEERGSVCGYVNELTCVCVCVCLCVCVCPLQLLNEPCCSKKAET